MNHHGWLWHLLNDPMRDNPASLALLVLTLAAIFGLFWWAPWRRRP